jgi:hypothetical protein
MHRALWSIALLCAACFSESETDASSSAHDSSSGSSSSTASGSESSSGAISSGDATSGMSVTSDVSADSTTFAGCGDALEVPPFAAPWSGPIVLAQGAPMQPPPPCPADFAPPVDPVVAAGTADACACTCTEPLYERCNVLVRQGTNSNCDAGTFGAGHVCEPLAPEMIWSGAAISVGDCTAAAVPVPPMDSGATSLCAPMSEDAACIELPEGTIGPCVYAEEMVLDCPAEYPVALPSKRLKCSDCVGCTELSTYCSMMRLEYFLSDDCSGDTVASAGNGQCSSVPGQTDAIGSAQLVEGVPYECDADVESHVDVAVCCAS